MDNAEFHKFADEYQPLHAANIAISGDSPDYFSEYKIRDMAAEYFAHRGGATDAPAVLDFGTGIGTSVPFVRKYLPRARLSWRRERAGSVAEFALNEKVETCQWC